MAKVTSKDLLAKIQSLEANVARLELQQSNHNKDKDLLTLEIENYQDKEALAQQRVEECQERNALLQEQLHALQLQMLEQQRPEDTLTHPNSSDSPTTTVHQFLNIPSPTFASPTRTTTNAKEEEIPLSTLARLGDDSRSRAGRRRAAAKSAGVAVKRTRNRIAAPSTNTYSTPLSPPPPLSSPPPPPPATNVSPTQQQQKTSNWRGGGSIHKPHGGVLGCHGTREIESNLKKLNRVAQLSLKRATPSPRSKKNNHHQHQHHWMGSTNTYTPRTRRRRKVVVETAAAQRGGNININLLQAAVHNDRGNRREDPRGVNEDEEMEEDIDLEIMSADGVEIEEQVEQVENGTVDARRFSDLMNDAVAAAAQPRSADGEEYSEVELMLMEAEQIRQARQKEKREKEEEEHKTLLFMLEEENEKHLAFQKQSKVAR